MEEYDKITEALQQLEVAKEKYRETQIQLEDAKQCMLKARDVVEGLQNTIAMPFIKFLNKVVENDVGYSVLNITTFINEHLLVIALGCDGIGGRCYLKTENGQPFSEFFAKNKDCFKAYLSDDGEVVLTEMSAGEKTLKEV